MCCYPSFVVLFIEHRQNRFKIILKGLGTWGMVIRNGFKSAASSRTFTGREEKLMSDFKTSKNRLTLLVGLMKLLT